jgi:regulation of enolase protein 1 (concanavalin A-like superfamily)
MNLLENLTTQNLASRGLTWDPQPVQWEPLPGGGIRVTAPAKADYFRDPSGSHVNDAAPFLGMNVTGDFIARAHVRPTFASTYDSGVIMVRHDAENWAKICFEKTDYGTTAAVSVVTHGLSDDANGADVSVPELWLQAVRAGSVFALHYSLDGAAWRMVRVFNLAIPPTLRVGIVSQSPVGPGTTIDFLHFSIEQRTVQNARTGI